ncbi:hypothetical protein Celaphus_00009565, partial [Cervus elaphus hippelaphus]
EASNVIKEEYTNANQVVFAKVDCDQHADIAQRYRISKCTTFKSLHNRMMMKRGYRGSDNKRNIIRYFEQKDSENYRVFERVANILHDDCAFLASCIWGCFKTRKIQWRQHNLQTIRAFCSKYVVLGIYDKF